MATCQDGYGLPHCQRQYSSLYQFLGIISGRLLLHSASACGFSIGNWLAAVRTEYWTRGVIDLIRRKLEGSGWGSGLHHFSSAQALTVTRR